MGDEMLLFRLDLAAFPAAFREKTQEYGLALNGEWETNAETPEEAKRNTAAIIRICVGVDVPIDDLVILGTGKSKTGKKGATWNTAKTTPSTASERSHRGHAARRQRLAEKERIAA